MSIQVSQLLSTKARSIGSIFSVKSIDFSALSESGLPVFVVDDFRVSGQPFGPHPHAGFSAVTYVFEDSRSGLRSRDSLGNDIVVGPGGIVWTQAGRGALHEEVPATEGRELHGLQIFVNLHARNKHVEPKVMHLDGGGVPEWRGAEGSRVRVAVGSHGGVTSPLQPAEPFNLLDVDLRHPLWFGLPAGHEALVYVVQGEVLLRSGAREQRIAQGHAIALAGDGRDVSLESTFGARLFILSGPEVREPMVTNGPFVMNDKAQLKDAALRYQAGEMGALDPIGAG